MIRGWSIGIPQKILYNSFGPVLKMVPLVTKCSCTSFPGAVHTTNDLPLLSMCIRGIQKEQICRGVCKTGGWGWGGGFDFFYFQLIGPKANSVNGLQCPSVYVFVDLLFVPPSARQMLHLHPPTSISKN